MSVGDPGRSGGVAILSGVGRGGGGVGGTQREGGDGCVGQPGDLMGWGVQREPTARPSLYTTLSYGLLTLLVLSDLHFPIFVYFEENACRVSAFHILNFFFKIFSISKN